MEGLEDPLPVHLRNEWPLATSGHVTQQLLSMHVNVHKLQGRRRCSLLGQWTSQLILGNASIVQQLCTDRADTAPVSWEQLSDLAVWEQLSSPAVLEQLSGLAVWEGVLDSVSAITLSTPGTWRMFIVNSAM